MDGEELFPGFYDTMVSISFQTNKETLSAALHQDFRLWHTEFVNSLQHIDNA